jgi:hypothetical protein
MHRQVGCLRVDEHGVAKRGVLVRHLAMPGGIAGTESIMRFLAEEVSPDTYVNVMDQYRPEGRVPGGQFVEIDRCITTSEYQKALAATCSAGLWRVCRYFVPVFTGAMSDFTISAMRAAGTSPLVRAHRPVASLPTNTRAV